MVQYKEEILLEMSCFHLKNTFNRYVLRYLFSRIDAHTQNGMRLFRQISILLQLIVCGY